MKTITAEELRSQAKHLGADLCGIAAVECFSGAPAGFHPCDVLPGCKSVIVMAVRFPASTMDGSSQAAYTFVRNRLADRMDAITFQIALELEDGGNCAIAIPSSEPYEYWDDGRRHGQGILSLKHAAVLAGLGRMGKNTLLVNQLYGNMLWLGAVISDVDLESDKLADYEACLSDCRLCLDVCPTKALDGLTIEQRKCREICAKCTEGGGGVYTCNLCRKVCPNRQGIRLPHTAR